MFHSLSWRAVGRYLAGLAVAFGVIAPAQADYVSGTWDPVFGAPFANLSWRGSVLADVPADCSELPAGIRLVSAPGCSLPWTTVSATVEFFDTSAPNVVVDTLDFTATISIELLNVNALAVIDGLGSADPSTSQVVVGGAGLAPFGVAPGTTWALKFDFVGGQTVASLYWTTDTLTCFNVALFCFEGRNNVDAPALVVVKELPEPASALLALLALGFVGRQRARRQRA